MEQALAETDVEQGSPPATAGDSTASTVTESQQTTSADGESKGVVPPLATAVDRDAAILARLDKGETPQRVRQNPKPVTRSPKATQTEAPADGAAENDETDEGAGADEADATESAYDGLDAKAEGQLRRAGLLENIDPAIWQAMSQKARQGWVATAKKILADKGRVGQQLGQARRQQAAAAPQQTNDDGLEPEAEEDDQGELAAGTAADEPRYTAAEWQQVQQGVRAQTQAPPAQQRTPAQTQPPALQEVLKPLKETFGDEVAAPLEQLFTAQQQALAQATQQNQVLAQQINTLARGQFEPQEREAFKALEEQSGQTIAADQRQRIVNRAFAFMEASWRGGERLEWREAIEQVGRSLLNPDINQRAQQDLLKRRDQRIRATPVKVAAEPRVNRVMSKDDKDAAALTALDGGRGPLEVRAALTQ